MSDKPPEPPGARTATLAVRCALPDGIDAGDLRTAAARTLRAAGVERGTHVTVSLVTPERMAELKQQAFGIAHATDVLAFGVDDPADPGPGPFVLGDVVVCPEVAASQARALGVPAMRELITLISHGLLHLQGSDHDTPDGERRMSAEQDRIVQAALA